MINATCARKRTSDVIANKAVDFCENVIAKEIDKKISEQKFKATVEVPYDVDLNKVIGYLNANDYRVTPYNGNKLDIAW